MNWAQFAPLDGGLIRSWRGKVRLNPGLTPLCITRCIKWYPPDKNTHQLKVESSFPGEQACWANQQLVYIGPHGKTEVQCKVNNHWLTITCSNRHFLAYCPHLSLLFLVGVGHSAHFQEVSQLKYYKENLINQKIKPNPQISYSRSKNLV